MILNKDSIKLFEQYQVNLPEAVLIKMEDGIRKDKELLITIDASHYGLRNNNGTIYRHDTMINDVQSFVYPKPKPIIERHRPSTSAKFGSIIAADYKLTNYHADLLQDMDVDGLTTEEYIDMCNEEILPMQLRDANYNGLAYVQVVGKLDDKEGIKKVLDGEFLSVSIGASPRRLICSICLQDQTKGICEHFANKASNRFMLAEQLDYEELSFVPKPADPFGRVVKIHDGQMEEFQIEHDINILNTGINVVYMEDFFEEARDKTIVCVDNICTIINQEEQKMDRKNISIADEFSAEILLNALKNIKLNDEDKDIVSALKLNEDRAKDWTARKFAVVQKTQDGEARRFPLNDELNVRAGLALIDQAEDLTEAEMKKAVAKLGKAAAKFGIELEDSEKNTEEKNEIPQEEDTSLSDEEKGQKAAKADAGAEDTSSTGEVTPIDTLLDSLKEEMSKIEFKEADPKLEDNTGIDTVNSQKDPIGKIFDLLKWYANDQAYAAKSLNSGVGAFLEEVGKEAIAKGSYDSLRDEKTVLEDSVKGFESSKIELETKNTELAEEVQSLQDECDILEETAKDLNYELRTHLVDEVVACKLAIGLLIDAEVEQSKVDLFKLPYNALKMQVNDSRKLTAKLKGPVNNKVEIETVKDPTLQDSDNSEEKNSQAPPELKDEDARKESGDELVKAFVNLFR